MTRLTDERKEGELKLCPLCGLAAARKVDDNTIKCRFCGVIGSYRNAPENIWNGRPLEGKLLAEVKALKAEKESMAEEYSQRPSHAIDDYYSAWANQQVEMEQLKKQLTQAEAERNVLITALGAGVSDCPYLTFWDDGADLEIPDWCTCSDTDEYGFECNVDAKDCWLKYAQQHAEKQGSRND